MLQKCAILGMALLFVGGLATGWVYNEKQTEQAQTPAAGIKYSLGPEEYLDKYGRWYQLSPEQQNQLVLELDKDRQDKTPEQLVREQQARLRADLEKLAAGQMNPGAIANILYGPGWESEVEQYKKLREQMEIAQIISIVCLSIGGVLFALCFLIWVGRSIAKVWRRRSNRREKKSLSSRIQLTNIQPHESEETSPTTEEVPRQGRKRLARAELPVDTFPIDLGSSRSIHHDESLSPLVAARARQHRVSAAAETATDDGGIAVLLADEPSQESEWSPQSQWAVGQGGTASAQAIPREPQAAVRTRVPVAASTKPEPTAAENALKEQAENLQKQIAEFKEMAQNVQQATRDRSDPLGDTLKELAQQVSAIREYAASQQDRVEKLQDGYDWGIIRTFCLRVIRCVDNIENRIENPPKDCEDLIYLEEVRDELLFAMESSGVEQFRPEINSEYRGQEKLAEAIREKQPAERPEQTGKIAQVLRPGYRYMIDDENYKVVRTAQVKLYG
ncbi:MAG TPA: nucleotide exchange factor GrpE [Sedimentisphaerales bacterium]|nr:nucleotide exchange factor GrpE [Sedimentisphaerales bacterium]